MKLFKWYVVAVLVLFLVGYVGPWLLSAQDDVFLGCFIVLGLIVGFIALREVARIYSVMFNPRKKEKHSEK